MSDDDVFSDDERMFFESGGVQTGKLLEPPSGEKTTVSDSGAGDVATREKPTTATIDKPTEGEDETGAIDVDGEGRIRDAKSGRFVPVQALRETRGQLKSTKTELAEVKAVNQKYMGVLERLAALAGGPQKTVEQQQQTTEPVKLIDPREDLIGAIEQERELRQKAEKAREETEKKITSQLTQTERNQVVAQEIHKHRTKDPADFDAAMQHLTATRERQYALMYAFQGEDGKPDTSRIKKQVMADVQGVIDDALASRGKLNPGEALYGWAKEFGYQKKGGTMDPAKQAADAISQQNGSGERTPAQQALDAISAGQDSSRTLAHAGGGGTSSGLTAEQFLAMDDDEIDARLHSNPAFKAEIDRVLGRR